VNHSLKQRLFQFTLLTIIGIAGVILLLLSWPRLQASIDFLPVDTGLSGYWESGEIKAVELDALIERARHSVKLYDHYRYWEGLSELLILSAQDASRPYWQRRQILEQSVTAAIAALRRAPARPRTWLRIARARALLGEPAVQVIPAWKMSILTGRVEPTLMLPRLELGFRYYNALADEDIALLRDQTILTWAVQRAGVLKRLQSGSLDLNLMRKVLSAQNPDIIAEMEASS